MTEKIININVLRKDLYKISKSVVSNGAIYNIATKNGSFVLISKEDLNSLIETLYLSQNPEYKKSLIKGMKVKEEDTPCLSNN